MRSFFQLRKPAGIDHGRSWCGSVAGLVITLVIMLAGTQGARSQSRESATAGRTFLSAGGGVSGFYEQYGAENLAGGFAFVDADSVRRFGVEGEGRWLDYHSTDETSVHTYLGGPRYHFNLGKMQLYVKGLAGVGYFNFPYHYAHGSYLVIAPGAGVDYRLNRRWDWRAVDFEYQYWPQFTFGAMNSVGISTGIRYRIF